MELEGQIAFQIAKVLRLKEQDKIALVDGKGQKGIYQIQQIAKDYIGISRIQLLHLPPLPPLVLIFALLKGDKNEIVLQKAMELGATQIIIFQGHHSIPKVKEVARKVERWKRIMIETMEQCLGSYLPEITLAPDLEQALKPLPSTAQIFTLSFDAQKNLKNFKLENPVLVIGPEGDFSQEEMTLMKNMGAEFVLLCPHLLKAETASIAGISQIQLLRL